MEMEVDPKKLNSFLALKTAMTAKYVSLKILKVEPRPAITQMPLLPRLRLSYFLLNFYFAAKMLLLFLSSISISILSRVFGFRIKARNLKSRPNISTLLLLFPKGFKTLHSIYQERISSKKHRESYKGIYTRNHCSFSEHCQKVH